MLTGNHFYNQTLKKSVAVFGTIFNNLRVVKHGGVEERVPIAYGPRQKFLARLAQSSRQDETIAIKVPRLSFEITDLSYVAPFQLTPVKLALLKVVPLVKCDPEKSTPDKSAFIKLAPINMAFLNTAFLNFASLQFNKAVLRRRSDDVNIVPTAVMPCKFQLYH